MKDNQKWSGKKTALVIFNCLLCVAIIVAIVVTGVDRSRTKNGIVYQGKDVETTISEEKNNDSKSSARLMCAGDNTIYKSIYTQAKNRSKNGGYDFGYAYEQIKEIISLSDIAFLNQESPIDPESEPDTYPTYNSPKELLDEMINIGFDVFNQANDHCLDKDISGAKKDIELFKSKQNIILTGLYNTQEDMLKPQTTKSNGITFSFMGFTEYTNSEIPEDTDLGLLSFSDERYSKDEIYAKAKEMIENAKSVSDVVCVSMHWATEDINEPDDSQEEIASKLLEYGADIIIGSGPHVLQPIEFRQNGDGEQAAIIWSLGNLITCQSETDNLLGGIADITVEKDNATGKTKIASCKLIPTITQYGEDYKDVHVVPLAKYSQELGDKHSEQLSMEYINDYYKNMFGNNLEINYKKQEDKK